MNPSFFVIWDMGHETWLQKSTSLRRLQAVPHNTSRREWQRTWCCLKGRQFVFFTIFNEVTEKVFHMNKGRTQGVIIYCSNSDNRFQWFTMHYVCGTVTNNFLQSDLVIAMKTHGKCKKQIFFFLLSLLRWQDIIIGINIIFT